MPHEIGVAHPTRHRHQPDRRNTSGGRPRGRERQPASGIFALVNTLAKQGRLTPEQEHFRRTNNDWYDAAYRNPTTVDPTVFDRTANPGAAAWFPT